LHHEVAGEAAGGLDDDGASAVAGYVGQEFSEARAGVEMISAAHGSVVELTNQLDASPLGERFDGLTLALVAVLVGADVCRAGRA
jgi:hypothetical protein